MNHLRKTDYVFLGLTITFVAFLYFDILYLGYSIIDDHAIPRYHLKKNHSASIADLLCNYTYDGLDAMCSFGKGLRYHPLMQFWHFLRLEAFGAKLIYWRLERLFFFLVSISMFYSFPRRILLLSPFQSFLFLATIASWYSFYLIVSMNLVNELYLFFFFSILIFTYKKDYTGNGSFLSALPAGLVSLIKENGISFVLKDLLIIVKRYFTKLPVNRIYLFGVFFSFLASIAVITSSILIVRELGMDVTAKSSKFSDRIYSAFQERFEGLLLLSNLFFLFYIIKRGSARLSFLSAFLFIQIVWNYYFYNFQIPTDHRYEFPIRFFQFILFSIFAFLFFQKVNFKIFSLRFNLFSISIIVLFSLNIRDFFRKKGILTEQNVRFNSQLIDVIKIAQFNPEKKIVFLSKIPGYDFERIFSVGEILKFSGLRNDFMIKGDFNSELFPQGSLDSILGSSIMTYQHEGAGNGLFTKLKDKISRNECISISYSYQNLAYCDANIEFQ